MQGLLVYIRNRYQSTKLRRIQMCVISENALDLRFRLSQVFYNKSLLKSKNIARFKSFGFECPVPNILVL